MSDKTKKIIYWATTGLLTVMILMYAGNSIFNNEIFSKRFAELGHPTYLIYPLTIAKILGLIAIWSNKSPRYTLMTEIIYPLHLSYF